MGRCTSLVVAMFLALATPLSAILVKPLNEDLVSVSVSTRAATRAEAEQTAREQAVLATAGRVLLDGYLIRADQLLDKYLRNYANEFVQGVEVLEDTFTGGQTAIQARVFVDYKALVEDLKEKRFLYMPAYRPQAAVFLEERLDGRSTDEPARGILEAALTAQGLKIYQAAIPDPPADVNLGNDPLLMEVATVAAERRNIEILFTGISRTTLREERQVYYDTFFFYDCELDVSMVRVDSGEVLHRSTAQGKASSRDRAEAISTAIERAAAVLAEQFDEIYRGTWPNLVQREATFSILFTGTDDELTSIIQRHLEQMGPETRVFLRKTFDRTAILTLSTPASRDEILEVLGLCPYPALNVIRHEGDDRFEVQVSG